MNKLVILIILLGIAFYMGYRQGKDHSFWAESIEVIKGNERLRPGQKISSLNNKDNENNE